MCSVVLSSLHFLFIATLCTLHTIDNAGWRGRTQIIEKYWTEKIQFLMDIKLTKSAPESVAGNQTKSECLSAQKKSLPCTTSSHSLESEKAAFCLDRYTRGTLLEFIMEEMFIVGGETRVGGRFSLLSKGQHEKLLFSNAPTRLSPFIRFFFCWMNSLMDKGERCEFHIFLLSPLPFKHPKVGA